MIDKFFSIGGLTIKIETKYQHPSPLNVFAFEIAADDNVDLRIQVLSNNQFFHELGNKKYFDKDWFSTYETNEGDTTFIFLPDKICNITHIWIKSNKKEAEIFIDEGLLSEKNISIIETTPFLMLFMTVLVKHNGFILHSAGVSINDKGYIFCGRSGSGKTTISNLFRQSGKAVLLTDEALLIRKQGSDVRIYGTPWKGSGDDIYNNSNVILECIYFIFHGEKNECSEIDKREAIKILVKQAFPYFWDKRLMLKSFSLMTAVTNIVPCSNLYFLPDDSVVSYIMQCEGITVSGRPEIKLRTWYNMKKKYLDFDSNNSLEIEVLSDSMTPALKKSDRVKIKSTKFHPVKIGSIILFVHFNDHTTLHRVVSITELNGKIHYRTKGDANPQKDYYLVPENEVIGVAES